MAKVDLGLGRIRYTADHVNRMVHMLNRYCTLPYRLVCLTDDPKDVECETQPIPAPHLMKYGSCWHRLWLFSTEAQRLGETLLSIDLDTVIVSNIDSLFEDIPFKIWRGAYSKLPYCGSMWQVKPGVFSQVWSEFDPSELRRSLGKTRYFHPRCYNNGCGIGSDQCWMALMLPNSPVWTAEDGVMSYRKEARTELPMGARIVHFHGREDPSLPPCQKESPWIKEHWL